MHGGRVQGGKPVAVAPMREPYGDLLSGSRRGGRMVVGESPSEQVTLCGDGGYLQPGGLHDAEILRHAGLCPGPRPPPPAAACCTRL